MARKTTLIEIIREIVCEDVSEVVKALESEDDGTSVGDKINESYSGARRIIEEGTGERKQNLEAIELLNAVKGQVNLYIGLLGNLEYAKYLCFEARKEQVPEEKAKLYDQSKDLLRHVLSREPKFKGAQRYLGTFTEETEEGSMEDKVLNLARTTKQQSPDSDNEPKPIELSVYGASLGDKFEAFYALAKEIIEEGAGERGENEEAIKLLQLAKLYITQTIGLVGRLDHAKHLVFKARKEQVPEDKTAIYDEPITILKGILAKEPKFKGAQIYLEQYTRESGQ